MLVFAAFSLLSLATSVLALPSYKPLGQTYVLEKRQISNDSSVILADFNAILRKAEEAVDESGGCANVCKPMTNYYQICRERNSGDDPEGCECNSGVLDSLGSCGTCLDYNQDQLQNIGWLCWKEGLETRYPDGVPSQTVNVSDPATPVQTESTSSSERTIFGVAPYASMVALGLVLLL